MDGLMDGETCILKFTNIAGTTLHFPEMCLSLKISRNHLLNIVVMKNWMPSNAI